MKFKKLVILGLCISLCLCGCGSNDSETDSETQTEETATTEDGHAAACTVDLTEGKYSEEKLDSSWSESSSTKITLSNKPETSDTSAVTIDGSIITITKAGTYVISGELSDGQLVVDPPKDSEVKLVLNGASIHNSTSSAIYVKEGKTVIVLADGTINTFTDGESYTLEDGEDEPDATIFAKDDLSFNGTGTLIVTSSYKDAVKCKDDLKFISGNYEITAADDAVVGKDSVSVKDGNFVITSAGDAIKATNTDESDKGYIMIDGGDFQITSEKDAIVAETLLRVNDGSFEIASGSFSSGNSSSSYGATPMSTRGGQHSGGGHDNMGQNNMPGGNSFAGEASSSSEDTVSTKGLKSYVELIIAGGTLDISSEDDAIHSDQNVTIKNGTFTISTNDDGIHAENTLCIDDGSINIVDCYEGLEAFDIIINGGDIIINASDDGINAAGDADSAANPEDDEAEETDGTNPQDNFSDFRGAGGMMSEENQGATLTINGGTIRLYASGDVIDVNGDAVVTDGVIIAQGPTNGGNGTLDYASSFDIQGGTFWGIGASGMAMNPSSDTQGLICGTVSQSIMNGDTITIADESGNVIMELEAETQGQWIGICSPELKKNASYIITIGSAQYSATAS